MTFPFPFNVYLCFTRIFVTLSPFRHSLCSLHQTIPLLFSLLMHPPPFYDFSHIFCLPSSPPQSVASDSTTSLLSFYFFDPAKHDRRRSLFFKLPSKICPILSRYFRLVRRAPSKRSPESKKPAEINGNAATREIGG